MTVSSSDHLRVSQSDRWIKDLCFKCPHLEFKTSGDVGTWWNAAKNRTEHRLRRLLPPLLVSSTPLGEGELRSCCCQCIAHRLCLWTGRQGSRRKTYFQSCCLSHRLKKGCKGLSLRARHNHPLHAVAWSVRVCWFFGTQTHANTVLQLFNEPPMKLRAGQIKHL